MMLVPPGKSLSAQLSSVVCGLILACSVAAQEDALRLRESPAVGYQYRVSTRVELSGQLALPAGKEKSGAPLKVTGTSAIDYDERVLAVSAGEVEKSLRRYRRVDFQRKVGQQSEKNTIRPEVRRLVLLRQKNTEVPFSPDGPLAWNEIDIVRTDVFTPALAGLFPDRAVRTGDRWVAATAAVQELTDLERIEEGQIECRMEGVVTVENRRHARVTLSGTVRGTNEDGPNRQQLDGYLYFDLESSHLSYLSLKGVHSLMDSSGKEMGRIEGQFVLTRQAHTTSPELSDTVLRGLTLEPNPDNTLLLYDNADLGIRFLYPRRWRLAGGMGRQVRLDGTDGSGLLITFGPVAKLPTAAEYLVESRDWFASQKARVVRVEAPRQVQAAPRALEHFTLDAEIKGERVLMDYYLVRQALGGATLAARLPAAEQAAMQKEVARIAQSLSITRALKE